MPPTENKRKGKAPLRSKTPVKDIDEGVSDSGLEYDEDPLLEESDDSGSEFVASEEEEEDIAPDENRREDDPLPIFRKHESSPMQKIDDVTDEDIMVNAAIEMSLQTARPPHASSSSNKLISSNPAAVLRAAAAERRLTRAQKNLDVDDFEMAADSDDVSASDSEEEPLIKKGKGKSKAISTNKKAVAIRDTSSTKAMTMLELRKMRREERRRTTAERKKNKMEELSLMKKLGRRLTYVSLFSRTAVPAFLF
jgi:DNA repair protein RAD16